MLKFSRKFVFDNGDDLIKELNGEMKDLINKDLIEDLLWTYYKNVVNTSLNWDDTIKKIIKDNPPSSSSSPSTNQSVAHEQLFDDIEENKTNMTDNAYKTILETYGKTLTKKGKLNKRTMLEWKMERVCILNDLLEQQRKLSYGIWKKSKDVEKMTTEYKKYMCDSMCPKNFVKFIKKPKDYSRAKEFKICRLWRLGLIKFVNNCGDYLYSQLHNGYHNGNLNGDEFYESLRMLMTFNLFHSLLNKDCKMSLKEEDIYEDDDMDCNFVLDYLY